MAITRAQQVKQMLRDGGVTEDIGFSIVKPSKDGKRPGYFSGLYGGGAGDRGGNPGASRGENERAGRTDRGNANRVSGGRNQFEINRKAKLEQEAKKAARDRENARIAKEATDLFNKRQREALAKEKERRDRILADQKRMQDFQKNINRIKKTNLGGLTSREDYLNKIRGVDSEEDIEDLSSDLQTYNTKVATGTLSDEDYETYEDVPLNKRETAFKEFLETRIPVKTFGLSSLFTGPLQAFSDFNASKNRPFFEKVIRAGKIPGLDFDMTKEQFEDAYQGYMADRLAGKTDAYGNPIGGYSRDASGNIIGTGNGGGDNYVAPIVPKKSDDDDDDTTSTENQNALNYRIMGGGFDFSNLADGGRAGLMDGGIMRLGLKDGELAYDASDASIFGSSAISVTPETMMDGFGNQVQKEIGNTLNPPLIEDVIQQKNTIEEGGERQLGGNDPFSNTSGGKPFVPPEQGGGGRTLGGGGSGITILSDGTVYNPGFPAPGSAPGAGGDTMQTKEEFGRNKRFASAGDFDAAYQQYQQRFLTGNQAVAMPASPRRINTNPSPLMRAAAADGGMMSPVGGIMDLESGRQMYFLGKLVKKAKRAVKKVVKSPFGKAALLYGLGAMGGSFGSTGKFFSKGMFNPGNIGRGLFGITAKGQAARGFPQLAAEKGLLGKLGITGGYGGLKPTLGGGITLGLGVPLALDLLGVGKEEDNDEAYQQYLKDMSINMDAKNRPFDFLNRRIAGGGFDYSMLADGGRPGYQEGGDAEPVAKKTMPLLDMDGMEKDYREDGGFVPIGRMERADDVPARLSKNEFVFTADAVRNAGDGDIDKGAEVMYNMMKNLESGGEVSEESQGLDGAREMFQTSKRLEEVL